MKSQAHSMLVIAKLLIACHIHALGILYTDEEQRQAFDQPPSLRHRSFTYAEASFLIFSRIIRNGMEPWF